MKHASYRAAIAWIAINDENGDDRDRLDAATVSEYVTTALIADLFGVSEGTIAADVCRKRRKMDREERNAQREGA